MATNIAAQGAPTSGAGVRSSTPSPELVMLTAPRSPAAEAIRALRVNLQFASVDRDVRTVVVTSAGPSEGKTTTLANLAIAVAESGSRVIMLDADLRRPGLHTVFGLENRAGLTSVLLSEDSALPLQDTPTPGLRLLASGPLPPNPSEIIASRRIDALLATLRQQADYVFIDAPPAAGLSDAASLAARADGVILVVGYGKTRRDLARRAKDQLERVRANVLGVVLAGAPVSDSLYEY